MVLLRQSHVLHTALLGARHLVHRPLRPALQPRQIRHTAGLFKAVSQGQKRGHSIDVFGRCSLGEAVGKPAIDDITHLDIAGLLVILIDAVQPNAVGPLPAGPAFGIDHAPVIQA